MTHPRRGCQCRCANRQDRNWGGCKEGGGHDSSSLHCGVGRTPPVRSPEEEERGGEREEGGDRQASASGGPAPPGTDNLLPSPRLRGEGTARRSRRSCLSLPTCAETCKRDRPVPASASSTKSPSSSLLEQPGAPVPSTGASTSAPP